MTTRAVPLRLRYREVPRLPRLAWVATIDRAAGDVPLLHRSAGDYRAETYAIRRGVRGYPKAFVVRHPEIASFFQVYDECLVIGSGEATFESGRPVRTIASFAAYRALVAEALGRLQDNFLSRYRDTPMQAFSTVSTGDGSAASTVLVKGLDLESCFTSRRSNPHIPWWLNRDAGRDDGRPI